MASIINRSDPGGVIDKVKSRSIPALIVFGAITLAAGFIGSRLTATSNDSWYREIEKPSFNPPSWVFGPVWTALYIAMAVAAWLGWRHGSETQPVQKATALFGTQLGLNVLWSGLFFAARAPGAALTEIVVLWSTILAWLVQSARVEPRTRWLILPYLAWTTFALVLNASIWWKNR